MKKCVINSISNSKGSSYIEFIFGLFAISFIIYTLMQFYFMINAQLLVLNTAKVALRNIEVFGGIPSQQSLAQGVIGNLATNNNIDKNSVKFLINGEDINDLCDNTWYPIRQTIAVELTVNYKFISGLKLGPNFIVPLSAKYVGSSQRLNKSGSIQDFVPITK